MTRPFPGDRDAPEIGYAVRPEHNAISELNANLRDGKVQLTFEARAGYLRSALEALHIPIESQLVVFSKTSLQQRIISANNPRTLFFNDSVAVGWVRGEPFVEVAAQDAQQGVIFYTLDQKPVDKPLFIRRDNVCLQCHEDYATLGVPGMLVRSVFPAQDGTAIRPLGEFVSDHRSAYVERWGGWYVTGKSGGLRHLGNLTFRNSEDAGPVPKALDFRSLDAKFETSSYLSPYSDIVALLVANHQMRMMNLLTRVGWELRYAEQKQPVNPALLRDAAREVVDYMLFIDEPPLPGRVQGSSGFAEKFSSEEPKDKRGRSLRQFDLERRLMRYPCSYMIYSQAFDALPGVLKAAIYARLWEVLSGQENGAKYARLSHSERQAIVDILRETKPGLPEYFQAVQR